MEEIRSHASEFLKAATYEVVNPVPESHLTITPLAPRIPDLNGKTICEVTGGFRADDRKSFIRKMLKERFAGVKFVTFDQIEGADIQAQAPNVREKSLEAMKNDFIKNGGDAVISGNGQ